MTFDPSRIQAAAREVGKAVRPVLEQDERGRKRQIGTAQVLRYGDRLLAVTAEHVVTGTGAKGLLFGDVGAARWPQDYRLLRGVREDLPSPDVAFAVSEPIGALDPAMRDSLPLEAALTGLNVPPGYSYLAVGFPRSGSRMRDAQTRLSTELHYNVVHEQEREVYNALDLDPRVFIVTRYDRDAVQSMDGKNIRGSDPHGMSGGALFLLAGRRVNGGPDEIVLSPCGVLVEYHEAHSALVATRIDALTDAVAPRRDEADRLFTSVSSAQE